ncbi:MULTISPECIES: YhcN/YlaJ family sporulation lipoprotein [Bacillaceae]|uniref:YhcN/YlaJ family sporulation lipoprotein n=1 Tax=Evansella alkalicola TaxID=745819 RepID=A0ABS6JU75_9BACI|nr:MULTISPECIES: YhcN/YlaJ family sporulation lipoprotein [Bacillaceae]MBU9722141.1 YhcN/YlaJ family sporulation lipoprotein [Bacillus alkalicola]
MKKRISSILVTSLCITIMSGCGTNEESADGARGQQLDFLRGYQQPEKHFVINRSANTDFDQYSRFGFGRYTDNIALGNNDEQPYAVYDRSLMAETIGQLTASLREINEAAALVTDHYVLVAYDSRDNNGDNDEKNRDYIATQVKNTAYSIVPAYYDVYVSDEPTMMIELEKFRGLSPKDQDYRGSLNATIEEMKQSPQGETINFSDDRMSQSEDLENIDDNQDINTNRAGSMMFRD